MSQGSLPFDFRIFVIDTNAIIDIKLLPLAEQWPCCNLLQVLVEQGHLAFPKQVPAELKVAEHPDAPGAWIVGGAAPAMVFDQPAEQTLADMQARVGLMFDPNQTREPADPYVVAMAKELADDGFRVTVVSADRRRKGGLVSVRDACDTLGIPYVGLDELLSWARGPG